MSITGIFIYLFIIAILAILFINELSYILILFILIVSFIAIKKYGYKMLIALVSVFGFFCIYRVNKEPTIDNTNIINQIYKIDEAKPKYLIVSNNNVKYLVYYDENTLYKDQTIRLSGTISKIEKDLDLDIFEFKDYLNNKRVFYQIEYSNFELIDNSIPLSVSIINTLTGKLTDSSYQMTKMLMFNDKYVDEDAYENLKEISALHLFVVSGFHISFLFMLISKPFKKKIIGNVLGFIICAIYVFILDFSISSLRALISLILVKTLSDKLNRLDIVAIPGILLLLIEPLYVYNYSFIMTFIMSFVITFINASIKTKSKIAKVLLTSLICFLAMIPIQLQLNYKINVISLVSNIILSYVVMGVFICCILGMILSYINGNIFGKVYTVFNDIISKISELDTYIVMGYPDTWMVLIYYALLVILLIAFEKNNIKKIASSFILIFIAITLFYNRNYLSPYQKVTFLNVYQGDCTIIQDSYSNKVMLIDTGGLKNYDIAKKKIVPYLNYQGINEIEIVVCTHQDYDHIGALDSLNNLIKINNIIDDCSIESVNLDKINLININKYYTESSSENDKSITLYGTIGNDNFLFTGDISSTIEKKIIDNNNLDVDILKVAHHGSKSSTSDEFIKAITPTYSIISVGTNYYGHPTNEVLEILEKNGSTIYRTDTNGSIRFSYSTFGSTKVETAK